MTVELEAAFETALSQVPARRHIQSIIVARGGDVLLERYFRDRRASDLSNVHSVTKSVVSSLVGLAVGNGLLTLETSLGDVFRSRSGDRRKRAITIEQLLTMTSG